MNASNYPRRALALLVLLGVAGGIGWALWPRERRETPVPSHTREASADAGAAPPFSVAPDSGPTSISAPAPSHETVDPTAPASAAAINAGAADGQIKPDNSAALTAIQEAATRYDASALPLIDPYLLHADPEVREAARDGMVQVGDAAAAKYLRAAADKVKDPREAVALLDAADFLELPPAAPVKKREGTAPSRSAPIPPRPR